MPELTTLAYLMIRVKDPFLSATSSGRMAGLWTIEPYVGVAGRAVRHEELVFVTESESICLGPSPESASRP